MFEKHRKKMKFIFVDQCMCKRVGADIGEIYLMFLTNICFPNKYIILENNYIISKTYILFSTATHEDHLKNYSRKAVREWEGR